MSNDLLFTNIIVSIIIFLAALGYFAFKSNDDISLKNEPITIMVSNEGYQPAFLQVAAGKEVKLHLMRDNLETCKNGIAFPQFNIAYPFMLDIPINVTLPPQAAGEVDFNCQDSDIRGKIVIV